MNKIAILKDLTKLANKLDRQGKYKVSNAIDNVIKKHAIDWSAANNFATTYILPALRPLGIAGTAGFHVADLINKNVDLRLSPAAQKVAQSIKQNGGFLSGSVPQGIECVIMKCDVKSKQTINSTSKDLSCYLFHIPVLWQCSSYC